MSWEHPVMTENSIQPLPPKARPRQREQRPSSTTIRQEAWEQQAAKRPTFGPKG